MRLDKSLPLVTAEAAGDLVTVRLNGVEVDKVPYHGTVVCDFSNGNTRAWCASRAVWRLSTDGKGRAAFLRLSEATGRSRHIQTSLEELLAATEVATEGVRAALDAAKSELEAKTAALDAANARMTALEAQMAAFLAAQGAQS